MEDTGILIRKILACLMTAGIAMPAFTQNSSCPDLSRSDCMRAALEVVDADMNAIYKLLTATLDGASLDELRAAQRAWITNRDKTCRLDTALTERKQWLGELSTDPARSACVYGTTLARLGDLRNVPVVTVIEEQLLKPINDYSVPAIRATGKGYAEVEFVAAKYTTEDTRYMIVGATDGTGFIGMQIPGEDMAAGAKGTGIYTFGFAIDFDNGKYYWSANGRWQNGEPGSAEGGSFKPGGKYLMRVSSPGRSIAHELDRGGIKINTGAKPFRYATPAGYQPFYVPAKSAAGDAYVDWIVPPYRNVAGLSLGQWSQRYWAWLLAKPAGENPSADTTGANCGDDQQGVVWFLAGGDARSHIRRQCSIPRGRYLFVPAFAMLAIANSNQGKTCAALETDGYGRHGFAAQRDVHVSINGERFDHFLEFRPYSTKCAPIVGDAGKVVADNTMFFGTFVLLQPPPPGDHTLSFGGAIPEVQAFRGVEYELHIE